MIELRYHPKLPHTSGAIVKTYLSVLSLNEEYEGWTINSELELVSCKGSIRNNDSWNYHNNYDDSENELYVRNDNIFVIQWFTLNKAEALNIHAEVVAQWRAILLSEILRLDTLTTR